MDGKDLIRALLTLRKQSIERELLEDRAPLLPLFERLASKGDTRA